MKGLIGMIKPLLGIMFLAILMGCIGNLAASFITILGGVGIFSILGIYGNVEVTYIFWFLVILAALRGVFRYAEQACNHYIAFKLLARIRHKVFGVLRRLAPAKLDGSGKGNLISIITSDIELLEVFYAHTISPIAIAVITSLIMAAFIGAQNIFLGIFAIICYIIIGGVIPIINGKFGRKKGQMYRDSFGKINTVVLDNLYGLEEIMQYSCQGKRLNHMMERTEKLEENDRLLKKAENLQVILTDGVILAAGIIAALISENLVRHGMMEGSQAVIAVIALISSFGPVAALSALSNNLNQTLASGDRVLDLLEEKPVVEDIINGNQVCEGEIKCENISFSYKTNKDENIKTEDVLKNFSQTFENGCIHGILGKSGCGKSTLLKLLMRFYQTEEGKIKYGKSEIERINTENLRASISYVTQETFLFQDTIENNIRISKRDASRKEVVEAAKKASIHDFIMELPKGYDTCLTEFGSCLSGGERQRIGLARAFLHDSKILYLDEPTSNIDSLNEGIILSSLNKEKEGKTIILVSHRKSTMGISNNVIEMKIK